MDIDIYYEIDSLIKYSIDKGLIKEMDTVYCRNKVLEILKLDDYKSVEIKEDFNRSLSDILNSILDWTYERGLLKNNTPVYRDLLDTKIMDCFISKPSEIINEFYNKYEKAPEDATKYFYELSRTSNYIRTNRIEKNIIWKTKAEYGDLDITINLSKPEKDPKAIEEARNIKSSSYPKCPLCKENEGYSGRIDHPARQNHRIIPITLNNEKWFLQYSPYTYYNEHSIIFNNDHKPMKICKGTVDSLLEFVEKFPHYFIGSNADLPIVGGSILSHNHFQGGNYDFAMAKAPIEREITFNKYPNVKGGIVKWPMSVIRLTGKNRKDLSKLGEIILNNWKNYNDKNLDIISHTDDISHNTITPIVRKVEGNFQLDLVLRNNRTDEEYPMGIFHPHEDVHHIKKENIGLIEVMGLAVLPPRLKDELKEIAKYLLEDKVELTNEINRHLDWVNKIKLKYKEINKDNIESILKKEIGARFLTILKHAGVFKRDEKGKKGFDRFINSIIIK
ncbi:UDP-glucose--hexose-1-phosphate uridylyltransferase [Dethiothermospora halolimnae]|uniref:UDP-glucose--hexose-1-phosphate uridylyltransferase n=1 Tax=Dethiothermospora halolimnae TaxID=3114390 RepID=UPI003CCC1F1F